MPRFKQLFFYNFQEYEMHLHMGQHSMSLTSQRAAEAYLHSGVRFKSIYGISDVWYWHVKNHQSHYKNGTAPPLPLVQEPTLHSHIDPLHAELLSASFKWGFMHSRPQQMRKALIPLTTSESAHNEAGEALPASSQTTQKSITASGYAGDREDGLDEDLTDEESGEEGRELGEELDMTGREMDENYKHTDEKDEHMGEKDEETGEKDKETGEKDEEMDREVQDMEGSSVGGQMATVPAHKEESEFGDSAFTDWQMSPLFTLALCTSVAWVKTGHPVCCTSRSTRGVYARH